MMDPDNDVSYLFIVGQIVFVCLLIAFVVFLAVSDRRASKRLDEEDKAANEASSSTDNSDRP
ncbi:MAG: hypothetical protein JKY90_00530 [Gammaproteobacteria bacterium]|nr:hypothetical protein [Gammaproteobacteria bacterium]